MKNNKDQDEKIVIEGDFKLEDILWDIEIEKDWDKRLLAYPMNKRRMYIEMNLKV